MTFQIYFIQQQILLVGKLPYKRRFSNLPRTTEDERLSSPLFDPLDQILS
jgi:hypothetical protein